MVGNELKLSINYNQRAIQQCQDTTRLDAIYLKENLIIS